MSNRFGARCVAMALLAACGPLWAHHSVSGEFDQSRPITFTGTIRKVEWTNPHIYTHVDVKQPDGSTITYRVEGSSPNALFRQGWRKDSLKVGDTVTVSGVRAKLETSVNVGMATITTADGRHLYVDSGTIYRSADTP